MTLSSSTLRPTSTSEWIANDHAKKSELIKYDVHGGFSREIFELLQKKRSLITDLARELLADSFPDTLHEDICAAVWLDMDVQLIRRVRRDPHFRVRVLTAYEFKCAVCAFDLRLGNTQIGLEAAHIKWHQAGGPDEESNGLALCVLHYKLFDRGAFTLGSDLDVRLSESLHGSAGFEDFLRYHGQSIRHPQSPMHLPSPLHLRWHEQEVFHGPPRYIEKRHE